MVILDLEGKTKEDILLNIAKFAKEKGLIKNEQIVYQKFLEREQRGATGIGNGIALPEACWIEMNRPYAFILCRTKESIDFQSLDGKPVRIILASLGRDKNDLTRLKQMANLTKFLKTQKLMERFLNAQSRDEVYALLQRGK